MASKDYTDTLIDAMNEAAAHITNATNSDSSLSANQTEITNNLTPLNANSQLITGLANPTQGTDALNRQTADSRYYSNSTMLDSI